MLENSRNRILVNTRPPPYKANRKMMVVLDRNTLQQHNQYVHINNQEKPTSRNKCHKCQYCDYRTAEKTRIKRHEMTHSSEKPYRCQLCDKGFSRNEDVERHLLVHSGEKPYKCHYCDYRAAQKGNVKVHERIHTGSTAVITPTPVEVTATGAIECTYSVATGRFAKEEPVDYENEEAELKPQDSLLEPSDLTKILDIKVEALDETELVVVPVDEIGAEQHQPSLEESSEESTDNFVTVDSVTSVALEEENSNPLPHEQRRFGEAIPCAEEKLSQEKLHKCQYCVYSTSHKGNLKLHEMMHTGETPYKCQLCCRGFRRKDRFKIHLLTHSGDKPYKCRFCDYRTARKANIKRHEVIHAGEKPYKCQLCNYAASRNDLLKTHEMLHRGEKPYKCQFCIYSSARSSNVRLHENSVHKDSTTVVQPTAIITPTPVEATTTSVVDCIYSVRPGRLAKEEPVEYENDVELKTQGSLDFFETSTFLEPVDLTTDIKVEALNETGPVEEIGAEQLQPSLEERVEDLSDYFMSVDNVTSVTIKKENSSPLPEEHRSFGETITCAKGKLSQAKLHKCQYCDYSTSHKGNFKLHEMTHTGEIAEKCQLCDKGFRRKDHFERHLLTHSGDKPYKCRFCDYKSVHKANVKRHELVHADEKPYKCQLCSYSASRNDLLRAHEMRHRGEKPFCIHSSAHSCHVGQHEDSVHNGERYCP